MLYLHFKAVLNLKTKHIHPCLVTPLCWFGKNNSEVSIPGKTRDFCYPLLFTRLLRRTKNKTFLLNLFFILYIWLRIIYQSASRNCFYHDQKLIKDRK